MINFINFKVGNLEKKVNSFYKRNLHISIGKKKVKKI